jgi:16S rRNA (uracil1498-N3)-methyltransferase
LGDATPPVFIAPRGQLTADQVVLSGPEGHHAATVRRLRPGERADLTDGAGRLAECVVAAVGKDSVTFSVVGSRDVPRAAPRIAVVQALAKGDRGELAVETMTEVGVDTVIPWAAARSVTRWESDRGDKALERWRSAAREAAKQSRRAWIPEVPSLASTADVAVRIASASRPVVLEPSAGPLSALPLPDRGEILVIVGPEGGISPDEREVFRAAGAIERRLGPTVLRTSTAGVAAVAALMGRLDRW